MSKHKIYQIAIITDDFHGLRISPNIYTDLSEIDLFLDVMTEVAKGNVKEVMS
jgi:hypothetical protein